MAKKLLDVISIGYGRQLFQDTNPERLRMEECATMCRSLTMVIFTHIDDGITKQTVDNLTIIPTNSSSRWVMLYDAFTIINNLIKGCDHQSLVITSQDAFETGLVAYLISVRHNIWWCIQEHADAFSGSYWRQETILNRLRYVLGKYFLRKANVIRVVSKRIESSIKLFNIKTPINRLPVAIDTSAYLPVHSSIIKRPVNKTEFQFISVARFVPQKNLFLLVRAFRKVYEVCPHARLVLIGQGPQHKLIQDQITKEFGLQSPDQGPVIMMSWTDDVPAFLRGADAYVLSSNYEGWGRVLIEAMCAQLPIVTTDVGCVGEVMQAGVHGIVVPVGDCDELTKAMIVMIKDTAAYQMYKKNLQGLPVHDLPGTHFKSYGQDWVRTLGVN